jgi:hypothetical protein
VLDHVFSGGTTAALDAKSKNPVWRELLRRAGGPTLRWLVGGPWSDLDYARTELLLPLGSGPRSATARSTSRSSGSRSGPPSSTSRRPGYLRRAAELELDAKERAEAVREIEALREALRDVATRLGRRRG